MIPIFLYWILILFEVAFIVGIAAYMLLLIYSSLMGSPYVPSKKKLLQRIFNEVSFNKKSKFLDLGCGDGRIVMYVARQYKIQAIGVDINPMMIAWARIKTRLARLSGVKFRVENIFKTNLAEYDIIYLFLMPKFLAQLKPKLLRETKKETIFISHGFKIENWDKYCYRTLSDRPFNTYFYKISE